MADFMTTEPGQNYDALAPDGSEIRLLCSLEGGSTVHCTLQPNQTSTAIRHKTVEEIWYCIAGEGQVWRRQGRREKVTDIRPGISLTIPLGTHFQFRNCGAIPLQLLIITMPPWPGADEAVWVTGKWRSQ